MYLPLREKLQRAREASRERGIARAVSRPRHSAGTMVEDADKLYASSLGAGTDFQLRIPDNIDSLRIDIGLSYTAPNSALWLKENPKLMVFGFEPEARKLDFIFNGKADRKTLRAAVASSMRKVGGMDWSKSLGKNVAVYGLAIDDREPGTASFNTTELGGTSSLLDTERHAITGSEIVRIIRLSDFLRHIPWQRFPYIEAMKVDTQGKDAAVLRSAGEFLKKIVYVSAEIPKPGEYRGAHDEAELDQIMERAGFEAMPKVDGNNKSYRNRAYKDLWSSVSFDLIRE